MRSRPRKGDAVRSLWRAELARGRELDRVGNDEGARAAFARAHAMAPTEPEPAWALARHEQRRGRRAEAERLYRLALEARPDWPLAAVPLARLVAARGQPTPVLAIAEARRILAPAQAAEPRHLLLIVVEAELLVEERRGDEARRLLLLAKARGADDPMVDVALARAENLCGIALASGGRNDEAAFAFKRACDLDRHWAPPRANLGVLWQRLGKRRQAAEQYQLALAIDPGHGLAHFNLGLLWRERGDLDGAARALAAALAADPPHADARVELAITLSARGEHARAITLFEEELRLVGPTPKLHTNLGVACLLAGENARAEAAFVAALALDDDYVPALRNLAHLYGSAGRLVEAAALLSRAQGNSSAPPASK
jgi:Flp pilus assembly protein TadD